MTLPNQNHPCWQKLASGGLSKIKTSNLGTQLLAKRLERSPEPISVRAGEVYAFFSKWERILTNEIAQLTTV